MRSPSLCHRRYGVCLPAAAAIAWLAASPCLAAALALPAGENPQILTVRSEEDTSTGCSVHPVSIEHSAGYKPAQPSLHFVDTATSPMAVCNDGSAPAYLVRRGFGAAAHRWVIQLQGGFECYDQQSCAQRATQTPDLVSSVPYQRDPARATLKEGIESASAAQNPDFYDANLVKVFYCSSDYWSGQKAGTGKFAAQDDQTWNFQGHAIAAAVIQEVINTYQLGRSDDEVLLTGDSAGGIGVLQNVNDVAAMLPLSVRLVAAPEAGYGNPDYPGFDPQTGGFAPGVTPYETILTDGQALWAGRGDVACLNAATINPTYTAADCMKPDVIANDGFVHVPMFIRESLDDRVQLTMNNIQFGSGGIPVQTQAQMNYVDDFGPALAHVLSQADPIHSVFGITTYQHVIMTQPEFAATKFTFGSQSTSIAAALGKFYATPCTATRNEQSGIPN